MMRTLIVIAAGALLIIIISSLYVVEQREQALVLQFGNPVAVIKEPGLHIKMPFVQNVVFFDNRILDLDAMPYEVNASDQKRLIVDSFVKYKIVDPLKFYQTVGNERIVRDRLSAMLESSLREVLGGVPLSALLSEQRAIIMENIQKIMDEKAREFGILIVDARIRRADLPPGENSDSIYRRMQTEREREAKELRALGAEEAQRIRSRADKERTILIAEAQKQSEITRGEGDAEATRLYALAFNQDPEFFAFYRTMQAYRETLHKDDTTLILSPDSDYLKYFDSITGGRR